MVSFLFAGIPSLRRDRHEDRDARVADPGAVKGGQVAGFISEWWPASSRNGGRLHVGKPGRINLAGLELPEIPKGRISAGCGPRLLGLQFGIFVEARAGLGEMEECLLDVIHLLLGQILEL